MQPGIQNGGKKSYIQQSLYVIQIFPDVYHWLPADKIADSTEKADNRKSETNTTAVSVAAASYGTNFEKLKLNLTAFALQTIFLFVDVWILLITLKEYSEVASEALKYLILFARTNIYETSL